MNTEGLRFRLVGPILRIVWGYNMDNSCLKLALFSDVFRWEVSAVWTSILDLPFICSCAGNARCDGVKTVSAKYVLSVFQTCLTFVWRLPCNFTMDYIEESSSGVVVRSTGAYKKLSGHPARPVLGWGARVECPVPSHYTCQADQSGYRVSVSWLFTVLRKRRKIEVPPTWCSMLGGVKDTTQGVKV